ncbi:hypothetical protein IWQ48_003793 [Labrenzia sp. EL_13]|uniref:hypothetical protein n=1 Tax=Stappiaceae TaxID=2821832 RepID=UPI0006899702|nr:MULTISPECIES: hypothetical protein [Stappiaceae]MBG6148071.1 hypothetical protein [Labrenzia sp. EL_142]MBG6202646.1 hypothetical protein [Labrenzia sp. EL_13]
MKTLVSWLWMLAEWFLSLPLIRIGVIAAFAAIGAALPKDLTRRQRAGTFFIGFMAALVFGEPLRELLAMSDSWAFGMAGVLAMTGRNLAVFVIRASKDPVGSVAKFLNAWRGVSGK